MSRLNLLSTLYSHKHFLINFWLSRLSVNGQECGGHGFCNCGVCECIPEFSGETCECSSLKTNCIAPDNTKAERQECSGHGTCKCNQCECDSSHFGTFCESSPGNESLNSLCIFYEPCVQCVINLRLERECSDFKDKCSAKSGNPYKSEFYDDISGKLFLFSPLRRSILDSAWSHEANGTFPMTQQMPTFSASHVWDTTTIQYANTNSRTSWRVGTLRFALPTHPVRPLTSPHIPSSASSSPRSWSACWSWCSSSLTCF